MRPPYPKTEVMKMLITWLLIMTIAASAVATIFYKPLLGLIILGFFTLCSALIIIHDRG